MVIADLSRKPAFGPKIRQSFIFKARLPSPLSPAPKRYANASSEPVVVDITVELPSAPPLIIEVQPNYTTDFLRHQVISKAFLPVDCPYQLFWHESLLPANSTTLSSCSNLLTGDPTLLFAEPITVQVRYKKQKLEVTSCELMPVGLLKVAISNAIFLEPTSLKFLHKGCHLKSNITLGEASVGNNSRIMVLLQPVLTGSITVILRSTKDIQRVATTRECLLTDFSRLIQNFARASIHKLRVFNEDGVVLKSNKALTLSDYGVSDNSVLYVLPRLRVETPCMVACSKTRQLIVTVKSEEDRDGYELLLRDMRRIPPSSAAPSISSTSPTATNSTTTTRVGVVPIFTPRTTADKATCTTTDLLEELASSMAVDAPLASSTAVTLIQPTTTTTSQPTPPPTTTPSSSPSTPPITSMDLSTTTTTSPPPPPPSSTVTATPAGSFRCAHCAVKLPLTAVRCRCGNLYCGRHRYSSDHSCSYDYRKDAALALAKANPLIIAPKLPDMA